MVNLAAATREVDKLLCINGYSGPSYVPHQDRVRIAKIVRTLAAIAQAREGDVYETREQANPDADLGAD